LLKKHLHRFNLNAFMIKKFVGLWVLSLIFYHTALAQVDTSYVYKTGLPYGTLDIRIAKSSTRYYYLQEGKTFSFRESAPGVKTDSYNDGTSWDSSPYTQGNLREKNGTSDSFVMNYRLLFPKNYNPAYAEGYPLIIMMHGAGERGNCWDNTCYWADRSWKPYPNTPAAPTQEHHALLNNDVNLVHGGQVHLQARDAAGALLPNDPSMPARAFPGFVLFPQNLNGWDGNSAQDAIRILRLIIKKYKVDQNKIYIHGLSNGGAAVYDVLKRAPWLFAAALPMSAIGESGIISYGLTSQVSNVPLWIFQGGIDTNPSPGKTDGYVKRFREAGFSVRYTKYNQIGHGVWNTAYNEPDFFSWMRSKSKSDLHVFADNPVICQTNGQGVKLELAAGFLAYQWERNGVIISGANGPTYVATTTGTYRARFSRISTTPTEAQWNKWSQTVTVGTANPTQAQLTQVGSVVLKDLNYYNNALLTSVKKDDHYYWYKDGTLLNLSGDQDDTTRTVMIKAGDCSGPACAGNGLYTLVTAAYNNCPTPVSEPVHIYFNDQAPINITAPGNFTATGITTTRATLNWSDFSNNEDGFEIWRRKVTSPASKWVMAGLTGRNVTSLLDTMLEPNATYQFKIRAVSLNGRSDYTPSASNQYLIVNTQTDSQIPTTPLNLTAVNTGIQQVKLTWQASTDNTGIRSYNIYYGSTVVNTTNAVTTYTLNGLPLNTDFTFTIRAVDLGGNLSNVSNQASAGTYVTGLYYKHTTGAWNSLDVVDWSIAEFTGKVNNFTLSPRTQEDYFNFQFEGYVYINTGGSYQFRTTSDDASRLAINNTVIVDNNGLHGNVTVTSAALTLAAGPQTINVKYIEYTGGQNLVVQYMGPDTGGGWINIPDAALRSGNSSSPAMAARTASPSEDNTMAMASLENATVYPNPLQSGSNISVKLDSPLDEPIHIQLMDMMGNSVYENTFASDQLMEGSELVAKQSLTKGIYLVVLKHGDTTVKKRIIVKE
jgi:hypothetical protein